MARLGFEPRTNGLWVHCSTVELPRLQRTLILPETNRKVNQNRQKSRANSFQSLSYSLTKRTSIVRPKTIRSPSFKPTWFLTGSPFSVVPSVEPMSSSIHTPSTSFILAWWRESWGTGIVRWLVGYRPMKISSPTKTNSASSLKTSFMLFIPTPWALN